MTEFNSPRTLDHLVLPVSHIDIARERYEKLGFTVAPDGIHPFGTENCCIFFKDGTFLEPIGIAQREMCEEQAIKGNTFVANDQAFRFRRGQEGFSHLVIKSDDAKADHQLYKSQGISGGRRGKFTRNFETPDGEKANASFRLAYAADKRSPDSGFFSCQVAKAPKVDRTALQTHANGVTGLKEVILSEVNPTDFQYFLQTWLNQREMEVDSFGMSFATENGHVSVMTPDGMQAYYGLTVERRERGMLFQAFVLFVHDLSKIEGLLNKNGIAFTRRGPRILISPAAGQGTTIMFEEENQ